MIAFCDRCGARCLLASKRNPGAKMLIYSKLPKGLCVNCATHDWLRNTYPVNMQLAKSGPRILVHLQIREQFAEIMRVAGADANPDEINWNLVSENWDLPFADKVEPRADNPITQKELDEIAAGKYKAIDTPAPAAKVLLDCGGCITNFEQLNLLKPGLGDRFKSALRNSKEKTMADVIHKTQEPHRVKCVLTSDEIAEAAMLLANTHQAMESLAIERKTVMTEFKQRMEKLIEQIHVTSLMVKEGVAMRSVKCELQLNFSKLRTILIRLDTGDIVEERDMTPDEKQMRLQFEKGKKTKKKK